MEDGVTVLVQLQGHVTLLQILARCVSIPHKSKSCDNGPMSLPAALCLPGLVMTCVGAFLFGRYKDSSAASRSQMDSGGVGVGATLQCLLLAWDRGGAKEDETAIVVRTSDLTQIIRREIVHS